MTCAIILLQRPVFFPKTLKEVITFLLFDFVERVCIFVSSMIERTLTFYIYICSLIILYYNKQYFVSSGFAFAHADSSVDILAVEAVPVEHLDETVVRKMLSEHTAKFQAAKDDYEKATHQIGIDVSTAMVSAIETMGK